MLTPEERDFVKMGSLAEDLKNHPGWSVYLEAVSALRAVYLPRALARGGTNFEKGAVYAMDLVLTCLDATIERREALLEREALESDEGGEEAPTVPRENVP